tara:strand:- start:167 stop:388 length:222 start_codon:yes stop_codon:yes gene_type:complete
MKKVAKDEINHCLAVLRTYMDAPRNESFSISYEAAFKTNNPENLKHLIATEKDAYIEKLSTELYKRIDAYFSE